MADSLDRIDAGRRLAEQLQPLREQDVVALGLHGALGESAVLVFGQSRSGPWLETRRGHRAIGVVYDPQREAGNYVATQMGARYDALLWLEDTSALRPLHHEPPPKDTEFETEPTGF